MSVALNIGDGFFCRLVGGLEHEFHFSVYIYIITYNYVYICVYIYIYLLGIVTLTDFHIFQSGRSTTDQLEVYAQPVISM
jgi:hypothetical protein